MDKTLDLLKESWNNMMSEQSMPPGMASLVSDVEDMPAKEELGGEMTEAGIDDANVQDIDLKDIVKTKTDDPNIARGIKFNRENPGQAYKKDQGKLDPATGKPYQLATRPQRLIHSSALLKILTPEGTEIDENKFRELISVKPKHLIAQNSKIAASGKEAGEIFYDLSLPAYQGLFYNEKLGKFQLVRTCPSANACKAYCYASRGSFVQYEGPWLAQARMINFLMNNYDEFKSQLISELNQATEKAAKQGKKIVLRWHDSGDVISESYMLLMYDVARQTPNIRHYAYTKQVDLVNKYADQKPDNFILNFSKGGTSDKNVDFDKEKHSKVVPYVLFKDLGFEKGVPMSKESAAKLKERIAYHYSLDPATVITLDELVKIPFDPRKKHYYNVCVKAGDSDDAAAREDVLGTYLLIH